MGTSLQSHSGLLAETGAPEGGPGTWPQTSADRPGRLRCPSQPRVLAELVRAQGADDVRGETAWVGQGWGGEQVPGMGGMVLCALTVRWKATSSLTARTCLL